MSNVKFKVISSELDQEFQIVDASGKFVVLAPTAKPHSAAAWHNKKKPVGELWESISTAEERKLIADIISAPGATVEAIRLKAVAAQALLTPDASTQKEPASMSSEQHEDNWVEFSHAGKRWSFDGAELALWDEEEEEFHFYAYHQLSEPTANSVIAFIDQL
ncbi:hypothetical protein [Pseudomonas sp. UMAB-40]|uniref:hypothetical protein n=1 Tax=Pseudomonas sp. UMAB-40 TaxID=1365407 RepID=UPI001C55B45E|nr:hypothetical protein [Pseudomonas sp. UMAB-40]